MPAHVGGARDPVDERQAVGQHRRGDRADQEELQRRLHRLRLALEEAGQVVERDRHQLEGHEEQDQVAGGGQDQHAQQRGQDGQVVLGGPPGEGDRPQRQRGEHADQGGQEEQALGEEGQLVLHQGAAEHLGAPLGPPGEAEQDHEADRAEHPHPALVLGAHEEAHEEDEQHQDGQAELEPQRAAHGEPAHWSTQSRLRSGIVAVSTGPSASEGQTPKSTIVTDQDPERRPLGPARVGQVQEVRIRWTAGPRRSAWSPAARRST